MLVYWIVTQCGLNQQPNPTQQALGEVLVIIKFTQCYKQHPHLHCERISNLDSKWRLNVYTLFQKYGFILQWQKKLILFHRNFYVHMCKQWHKTNKRLLGPQYGRLIMLFEHVQTQVTFRSIISCHKFQWKGLHQWPLCG